MTLHVQFSFPMATVKLDFGVFFEVLTIHVKMAEFIK